MAVTKTTSTWADPIVVNFKRPPGLSQEGWGVLQNEALDLARSLTPVDTGMLRGEWDDTELTPQKIQLTNDSKYGDFVDKGTTPGSKYPPPKGGHGIAMRNFSGKIYGQLSALAGQLMQQFPSTKGGTEEGRAATQLAGQQTGKGFEYGRTRGVTPSEGAFAQLGAGVGGSGKGDFGSRMSVNSPGAQAAIGHLRGPARQDAYLKYLAGTHRVPR